MVEAEHDQIVIYGSSSVYTVLIKCSVEWQR